MKFTSANIRKAWQIRKTAAQKFGCPVMEISWKLSLQMAVEAGKEEKKMIATLRCLDGMRGYERYVDGFEAASVSEMSEFDGDFVQEKEYHLSGKIRIQMGIRGKISVFYNDSLVPSLRDTRLTQEDVDYIRHFVALETPAMKKIENEMNAYFRKYGENSDGYAAHLL